MSEKLDIHTKWHIAWVSGETHTSTCWHVALPPDMSLTVELSEPLRERLQQMIEDPSGGWRMELLKHITPGGLTPERLVQSFVQDGMDAFLKKARRDRSIELVTE